MANEIDRVVPAIYACFADVLYEKYKWDADEIENLFIETQTLWTDHQDNMKGMLDAVAERTGIELRSK